MLNKSLIFCFSGFSEKVILEHDILEVVLVEEMKVVEVNIFYLKPFQLLFKETAIITLFSPLSM